ncbi:hypothetical protein D3C72_2058300 [compost metagenome]
MLCGRKPCDHHTKVSFALPREQLVKRLDRRGAFPYSGGDPLDGAASCVANSEHAGQTGFHWQR